MRPSLPLALSACLVSASAFTQTAPRHRSPANSEAVSRSQPYPSQLPITHVSLYKNGVGFFEHAGRVTGDQAVSIDLTTAQLNDVLQSLTAIDLNGGHITGANYNSTTPLVQQLRALRLSLGEEPSQQALYDGLRGARAEVTGSGAPFEGRILSLEARTSPAGADENKPATERLYLTLVSDAGGVRTLELTSATTVRLLDTPLRTDLNSYLTVLAGNRSEGVRHLTLTDRGTGTRDLRVSFLSEVPIWKSTYRILFTDPVGSSPANAQTATLQGLSVIDNTTGEDWNNVQLSLIAGSPQSFIQPLAQPIYSRRPEIPIAQDAQLTPQTHDSAVDAPSANATMTGMGGNGSVGGPVDASQAKAYARRQGGSAGGLGIGGGGIGYGVAPSIAQSSETVSVMAGPSPMIPYETVAANSTVADTTIASFDDYFAYNLTDPVTIPRNGSALVPILQTKIDAERVTLYSPGAATPLRALWITNTSTLTLDRGSFSIIENGAFGGEGLLETIHPGERRLLSYAADQAVVVSVDHRNDSQRVTSITASRGVLRATTREVAEVEYLVHNAAPEPRLVIVEQPRRAGWTLDSEPAPAETTPTAYRFRVSTAPRETVRLHIGERHTLEQRFRLTDSTEEQLTLFLRNANATPSLLQQLEPVFAAKRAVASLDAQLAQKQSAITQLIDDQKRVRENLGALKGSAEERTLAKRYTAELNGQEDTLAGLRRDQTGLQAQRQAAQADLETKIEALSIDEKLGS